MDKEHGKINLEEWVNKELIKANKINKYNQNIDNLWIQIEYLDSLIGENVESNKIIFHSGLEDVGGDTVEDFLNYVKNQLWLLGSAHIDINNSIKTIQTNFNNLENKKYKATDVEFKKYTYVNVGDFLNYLDNQLTATNDKIKTNEKSITVTNTNVSENANSITGLRTQLKGINTSLASMKKTTDSLKDLTADKIIFNNKDYSNIINVNDFLVFLDNAIKTNTVNIDINKANIENVKKSLNDLNATEVKCNNENYSNVNDFLNYLNESVQNNKKNIDEILKKIEEISNKLNTN